MEIPIKKKFNSAELLYEHTITQLEKAKTNKELINILSPTNKPMFLEKEFNQFSFIDNQFTAMKMVDLKFMNLIDLYSFN